MKSGFTLIELAITLIIVGLVTVGVFTGRELIEEAKLQKTIKELRNIHLAYTTFVTKYEYPPGDVPAPTRFFPECNSALWGPSGNSDEIVGDGDGIVNSNNGLGLTQFEMWCSWMQLAKSDLYHPIGPGQDFRSPGIPTQDINFENGDAFAQMIWPGDDQEQQIADILDESGWINGESKNLVLLFGNYEVTTKIGFTTPEIAKNLDIKIDDGKPGGSFRAYNIVEPCFTNGNGYFPTADSEYDTTLDDKICALGYILF